MFTSKRYIEEFQIVFVLLVFTLFFMMQAVDSCSLRPVAANQPSGPHFSPSDLNPNGNASTVQVNGMVSDPSGEPVQTHAKTGQL